MIHDEEVFDLTIIGGGPAGLFTAFYAGMRQMSVKIIESLPQLGGQLAALYPEKNIYDIAGFPKVSAQDLIDNLYEQMYQFKPVICLGQSVEQVKKLSDETFRISTNKEVHHTKTIIITAGNGAFKPRKLQLAESEKYEGENLHYFIKDMNQFAGRRVILFGGGDSAVDWSLMLEPIADSVTIVHRREKFRAHEYSVEQLRNSKVEIRTPYVPVELIGESRVEQVVLEEIGSDRKEVVEVDDVIVNYGFVSSLGPIKDWGLDIEKNSIVVNSKMETNIKGIYAVGDICTYEGKIKLITTGFGEAPVAVSNAKMHIDPKARLQPQHSTSILGGSPEKKLRTKKEKKAIHT
ncbi:MULTISPECIES: NAD(P)/FAD-dependent oxidoreductase [Siminovitchia]|uniref:NAD(P)/FAD-dependent oxidoreductase n=1 Tax=Siminovitchia TaxID=2837510 RepID=UPI00035CDB8B|nr:MULTISPECIES: NAD(P)/FAD-dependent oxidoreductase [Siminovitchia]HBZ08784.1 NAD(P)/FAD-dependent oxidoreductase [Bacillus sp. (in: firmicutes)]